MYETEWIKDIRKYDSFVCVNFMCTFKSSNCSHCKAYQTVLFHEKITWNTVYRARITTTAAVVVDVVVGGG